MNAARRPRWVIGLCGRGVAGRWVSPTCVGSRGVFWWISRREGGQGEPHTDTMDLIISEGSVHEKINFPESNPLWKAKLKMVKVISNCYEVISHCTCYKIQIGIHTNE